MRSLLKTIGILIAALCGIGLLAGAGKPLPANAARNWNATVVKTADEGYLLGNPDAPVKLVEYISYTCPHCAHFEQESDAQLRIGFIATGKGSIEVRSYLRNGLDVTMSLLAHCGPPSKFFGTHSALLRSQSQWMATASTLTEAQRQRWASPNFATGMRAVASDLNLYEIMEKRGIERAQVDRCLADKPLADRLAKGTKDASEIDDINATPGFKLNGVVLAGTYSWDALKPQIEARLR